MPNWIFRELVFPRPMDAEAAVGRVRMLACDPHCPSVVLEARATDGEVRFIVGAESVAVQRVPAALGATALRLTNTRRPVTTARRLAISNRQRSLAIERIDASAPAILAALANAGKDEELVLQLVLGPRLSAQVVPSEVHGPVPLRKLLVGADTRLSTEARTAMVKKLEQPGFASVARVGVTAKSAPRRRNLLLGLLGALRQLQGPGTSMWLTNERPERLDDAARPWRFPLRLNASEVACLAALPVGEELPGLPPLHPKPLAPVAGPFLPSQHRLVVAKATAPGVVGLPDVSGNPTTPYLTLAGDALLRHIVVTGPTGTGKSVLLENLMVQHIEHGHGLILAEPKGDLVNAMLGCIPAHRLKDVVLLEPDAESVVGLNPLAGTSPPELRADALLSVFTDMWGEALGVRSKDILHSCLLTLAHTPGTSLVDVPRLLSDAGFRTKLVAAVADDPALMDFWTWWENLAPTQQAVVSAPLANKMRQFLLRRSIRRVIGQAKPRFDIREVFTKNKILLVPLPVATLGAEGSALLGSLLVAAAWDAARERSLVPPERRRPVMICLDEFQTFARLPDIEQALDMSRGYAVGWVLAHQHQGQLSPSMRAAVAANVRSRVAFQLAHEDATVLAKTTAGHGDHELAPEDFTRLPAYHVYASLMEHGQAQPFASGVTLPPGTPINDPNVLRQASAERYGTPVAEIDAAFTRQAEAVPVDTASVDAAAIPTLTGVGRRARRTAVPSSGPVASDPAFTQATGGERDGFRHETSSSDDPDVHAEGGES